MSTSGTHSWGSRRFSLHTSRKGPFRIPLQSLPEPRSSSGVEAGTSGFLSRANMHLGVSLGPPLGSQDSSRVEPYKFILFSSLKRSVPPPVRLTLGIGGFLSRCHRAVTPSIVFAVAPRGDRRVSAWESGVSGVPWDFGSLLKWWDDTSSSSRASSGDCLLLRCDGNASIPSMAKQGNGPSSPDEEGEPGLLLSCCGTIHVPLKCSWACRGTS